MTMTPRLRKLALTAHVTFSAGWLGAVVAYLPLAITGLTSQDGEMVRAAYPAMELIGWVAIVPLSLAALLTGLVQSLGTEWGLVRHHWVLAKFLLTVGGTTVLLLHMPVVSRVAGIAAEATLSGAEFGAPRVQFVVHAGGGLAVLLTATALSVYKPWGRTRYGRRLASAPARLLRLTPTRDTVDTRTVERLPDPSLSDGPGRPADCGSSTGTHRRVYVMLGVVIGLVLLFVLLHLTGRGHVHGG
jgi:hypothetical protein